MTDTSIAPNTVLSIELASGAVHVQTGGSGPGLLLLHHDVGPMGWGAFHEELAQRFTVFAPDMPGFGDSPRAEWARHPRDLAAMMLALARRAGLNHYTLVGLGFGGWVAAEMASFAAPELGALVLSAPAGIRPDHAFILDQVMEEPIAYLRAGFSSSEAFEAHFPDASDKALRATLERPRVRRSWWRAGSLPLGVGEQPTDIRGRSQVDVSVSGREGPVRTPGLHRAIRTRWNGGARRFARESAKVPIRRAHHQ